MYRKYFFDDFKIPLITGIVLISAIIFGSVFCGISSNEKVLEMSEYLTNFLSGAKNINRYGTSIGALTDYAIMFGLIFVSAFFKPGIILNFAVLIKRGFVIGFTLSSFFKVFGGNGILAILAMIPELIIFLPGLLFFSSTSTKMSFSTLKNKKNFLFFFIISSIFFATIFCASAFLNGYLTTTFMKLISKKIL